VIIIAAIINPVSFGIRPTTTGKNIIFNAEIENENDSITL
jgi:hypothetical protein